MKQDGCPLLKGEWERTLGATINWKLNTMSKFIMLNGATVNILSAKALGEKITGITKALVETSQDAHEVAVQCALHVWSSGDTSLAKRLCESLEDVTGFNVQGLRKWFGDACPMTINTRTKEWKLLATDSDTYTKYIERMNRMTTPEPVPNAETDPEPQPDAEHGPGNRVFFIGWCAEHPFWTDGDVQNAQRQNIRIMNAKNVIGLAFGIRSRYEKALTDGLVVPSDKDLIETFLDELTTLTSDFQKKHAVEMVDVDRRTLDFKKVVEAGGVTQAKELTNAIEDGATTTEATQMADGATEKALEGAALEVGGDVTEGEVKAPALGEKAA